MSNNGPERSIAKAKVILLGTDFAKKFYSDKIWWLWEQKNFNSELPSTGHASSHRYKLPSGAYCRKPNISASKNLKIKFTSVLKSGNTLEYKDNLPPFQSEH